MSNKPDPTSRDASALTRRRVFAGAGGAGALAAIAAVLPATQAELPVVGAAKALRDEGGYQLTEHVKRYYQTARI